jgi:hypothetical protein
MIFATSARWGWNGWFPKTAKAPAAAGQYDRRIKVKNRQAASRVQQGSGSVLKQQQRSLRPVEVPEDNGFIAERVKRFGIANWNQKTTR